MKVLQLYCGYESLGSMIIELGFGIVSCGLETFDINQYPKKSNILNIVFVDINNKGLVFIDGVESDCMLYGQELIEYYDPTYHIILDNNIGIEDDIIMWGLPVKIIKQFRAGKIINTRVWNNIFKWRPRFSNVYILQKTILLEFLGSVQGLIQKLSAIPQNI